MLALLNCWGPRVELNHPHYTRRLVACVPTRAIARDSTGWLSALSEVCDFDNLVSDSKVYESDSASDTKCTK